MIELEDNRDKEKLKNLEIAANNDQVNKDKIFEIYSNISFDLKSLIQAEDIYQTFDDIDARALIYQKNIYFQTTTKIKLSFYLS